MHGLVHYWAPMLRGTFPRLVTKIDMGDQMKKFLVAGATALALAAPVVVAPPAQAADNPWVTKWEFRHVKKGMTKNRVQRIFDIRGRQTWFSSSSEWCSWQDLWACASQSRDYRTRSRWGSVTVDYIRNPNGIWRVDSKYAYWG